MYAKVNRKVVVNVDTLRAYRIRTLGVFAEERPVNAFFGHFNGANVRKKVKLTAHCNVCALKVWQAVALAGRGCRTFQEHVAFFNLRHNVVRD